MNALQNFLFALLGPDGKVAELTLLQVSLRALFIFIIGLALVRIGDRRSLSEKTAFDAIFIVLIGSILSRAINGTAPFVTTIAAGVVLMLIHRACAFGACKSHAFGKLIKGRPVTLVRNGEIDRGEMRRALVSDHDLEEDLRLDAQIEGVSDIKIARLERSGDISFIKKSQ
ncbi:MAG: DUF421 domain-containing protein [Verrucomicrobia bacterium]|nr:MAG: DUF421 domain-containing protein [Verrucomicrobiota bacterium]